MRYVNNNNTSEIKVTAYLQTPYYDTSRPSHGMMRMQGGVMQVYDGNTWHDLVTNIDANLSDEVRHVLNWARVKMAEEASIKKLMDKHPGLKDAKERFEIMLTLVREDNNQGNDHGVTTSSP
jgi:hypothetical protein